MSPTQSCLVCGKTVQEVERMHYFPRNLERQNLWREALGIKGLQSDLRNFRICCDHFTAECYTSKTDLSLLPEAVPTLFSFASVAPRISLKSIENLMDLPATPITTAAATAIATISTDIVSEKCGSTKTQTLSHTVTTAIPSSSQAERENLMDSDVTLPELSKPKAKKSIFKEFDMVNATAKEKTLNKAIRKKHDHIRKLKTMCKRRGQTIKNISKLNLHDSDIVKDIFKGMSSSTRTFMTAQIRCAHRIPKGRRWTMDEKILSLALHKRSPKCYSLLRKLVALPSRRTLTTLLERVPFKTGLNDNIFKHLNSCLSGSNEANRLCTLAFDEMAIREHIQYDKFQDRIVGFEDLGTGRMTNKIANHALVFMAQGVRKNWKQPIAYYFSNGGVTADQLQILLLEVLEAMEKADLHVVATICDMGSANVKMLKQLGSTVLAPFFISNGRKIYNVFDVCHLLKCIRNNFHKYNIRLAVPLLGEEVVMEARWSDVKTAYEIDEKTLTPFRSMPKLKNTHLNPVMQQAMKVKLAAQVMSHTVAAFVYTLISNNTLPQRALATATLVAQVDEIFDSLNGGAQVPPDGKRFCCVVKNSTGHVEFWKNSFKTVKSWNIIRKPSDAINPGTKPPSQIGWLQTLAAMPLIWETLQNKIDYLRPRTFNQDSLENLFGAIRSSCGSNENPTVPQFVSALKSQIINGLAKQNLVGSNCEEDDATILSDLRAFLEVESVTPTITTEDEKKVDYISQAVDDIAASVSAGNTDSLSVAYVSGYIAKRLLKDISCAECKYILEGDRNLPHNQFIQFKEYSDTDALFYPSENLVIVVGQGITLIENNLRHLRGELNLQSLFNSILTEELDFHWLTCAEHHYIIKNSIIKGICRIGLPWYCTRVVRNLKDEKKMARKLKKLKHQ